MSSFFARSSSGDAMREEELFIPADRHRYIVLIIYDIVDNKRRNAMVKCLSQYAIRVQKSCFEGFLTSKQYDVVCHQSSLIIESEDSLRIYLLQEHAHVVSWGSGECKTDDVIIY